MTDVFRECRERVSAQDAARRYGLEFDRRGWCKCPFHGDTHASMSFRDGRFRCWACNESGDSIDFTGKLLGLEPLAAVERLNADFMLNLPLHRKPTPAETEAARRRKEVAEAHKQFEEWRKALCVKACEACRVAHNVLQGDTSQMSEREAMAVQWQAYHEYLADALTIGEPEEQMEIFRDRQVIESRIEQILNGSPMKSSVA
mgnify:CR=1 FL=1